MDDVEAESRPQLKYPDDVHPDPGQLRLGRQLGGPAGLGRVEHLGDLFGDGHPAGLSTRYGHLVRGQGLETEEEC